MSTPRARRVGGVVLLAVCSLYGAFGVLGGLDELARLLGAIRGGPQRGAPWAFVLHATAGGVALITGAVQLVGLPARRWRAHRRLGRVYVAAASTTSLAGAWSAVAFDDPASTRAVLLLIAAAWLVTTTVAFVLARRRRLRRHREWMLRSVATGLFFTTFELWVAAISAVIGPATGRPLGILASWLANAAVAEWWIHRTRPGRSAPSHPHVPTPRHLPEPRVGEEVSW